jgi:hypothetical protein
LNEDRSSSAYLQPSNSLVVKIIIMKWILATHYELAGSSFLEVTVRNAARIKLGYYSLPQEEGKRLRGLLEFSAGTTSVVDPCVGTGAALHQLTDGAVAQKHGVELDANRAAAAATSGITTIQGDLFNTIAKVESFSFLYLNPPYDSEIGSMAPQRERERESLPNRICYGSV